MSQVESLALSGLAPAGSKGPSQAQLEKVAQEFEAVFIAQVLNGMTSGLEGDGPLSGADTDAFADMLQQEYGKLISRSGGIGVGDSVLQEMLKMQEIR